MIETFYGNNKLVKTSITYIEPSDLGRGEIAPFDLFIRV